ncbi:MAG: hypothetical protein ACRCXZ_07970, partial [Patescibacteria group bacterium]
NEDGAIGRAKVKFETYLKLHKAKCSTSNMSIWLVFRDKILLNKLLGLIPDEFYPTVMAEVNRLESEMVRIDQLATQVAKQYQGQERRHVFESVDSNQELKPYVGMIMRRYTNIDQDISDMIYKFLRPDSTIFLLNDM